ncbi:MAG: ATP-binding protein [Christensenellaceae bacterium]|nr:ATP-binding protein [Christensenellaceae bacterium]
MAKELRTNAEKRALEAENLAAFQGIKLLFIRNEVEKMLSLIGQNGIFDQYTRHDISHIDGMLNITDWVIPEKTKESMSKADWLMLVLSIYFHDLGMLVTKAEFEARSSDAGFNEFKNRVFADEKGSEYKKHVMGLGDESDRFLYQEYVRTQHAIRIQKWISDIYYEQIPEQSKGIVESIRNMLHHLDSRFLRDLGQVCASHHLDDLDNFSKYNTCAKYGNSSDEQANLQYVSIILRTADILHITNDRTPSVQFFIINPSNAKSIIEWQKQMAVKAVTAKKPRNADGNIDESLPKDTIEISAYFDKPDQAEAFFGLSSYIMYMRQEIQKNYDWVQSSIKKEGTLDYLYPWRKIDDEAIETLGFEPHQLQFTVDQSNILQMLVGHTLYNDSSVVIRELIQNGIDAIKLQYCIENHSDNTPEKIPDYIETGAVHVVWEESERILRISDNGTGMTIYEIENYLLKVGTSKYRTETFQKKYPEFPAISRFGIGILTCFLIADDIDIATNSVDEDTANLISLRNVNGKYLLKKLPKNAIGSFIANHGTEIVLHVRSNVNIDNILSACQKWIVFPQCKVTLSTAKDSEISIGYRTPKDALIDYLNSNQYKVDEHKYKIEEISENGITLAYALRYNKYLNEWSFISDKEIKSDNYSPIGLCIEGIRVEFATPGFNTTTIVAVANAHNCPLALTNVARSAIEENGNKDQFLRTLYGFYAKHIQLQINTFQQERSLDWAIDECKYVMLPLLQSSREKDALQNKSAFFDAFDELHCIVIETCDGRKAVSVKEINNLLTIKVVDSDMVTAATSLLREVKNDTTLFNLLHAVRPEVDISFSTPILCHYDRNDFLCSRAISGKQVSSMEVIKEQRRVDLEFSSDIHNWDTFSGNRGTKIHIPIIDFDIKGLSDEFGVYTIDGIYLSSKNPFLQYLKEIIKNFDYLHLNTDYQLVSMLLIIACDDQILRIKKPLQNTSESLFNRALRHIGFADLDLLWQRIDKDDFIHHLFKNEYVLYRPKDWSRHTDNYERGDYYMDFD